MKTLIILSSYHHKNTEKIAKVISEVLDADIINTEEVNPEEILEYDLIGFGSGVYDGHNHMYQLNLADKMPDITYKKVFIFSTTVAPKFLITDKFIKKNHLLLREKLQAKGYETIEEFGCAGWNTNSVLKYIGGFNKKRPNETDLEKAKNFAITLKSKMGKKEE
jgi:flavodoxin